MNLKTPLCSPYSKAVLYIKIRATLVMQEDPAVHTTSSRKFIPTLFPSMMKPSHKNFSQFFWWINLPVKGAYKL